MVWADSCVGLPKASHRLKPQARLHPRQQFIIAVVMQQSDAVLDSDARDEAIVRTARREALPATPHIKLGGSGVGRYRVLRKQKGKCAEVGP